MVTIEQKLLMFSKLLHRTMNNKFAEDRERLKKEYEEKIHKSKEDVDRQVGSILDKARKKAEMEETELISKMKMNMKRENLLLREKHFTTFMEHLKTIINEFILSDRYKGYLLAMAQQLVRTRGYSEKLVIYMTAVDREKYEECIKQELLKSWQKNIIFKSKSDSIIGGFIVEDIVYNTRTDLSIYALLDDNKSYIMEILFKALKVGESDGI